MSYGNSNSYDSLPPLRDVIREHALSAHKHLGQHFLLDNNLLARIVRAAGDLTGINVIEIGPGPGGLTRELLQTPAASVVAVEKDPRCVEALRSLQQVAGKRLQLVAADALEFDVMSVPPPRAIISNLPYNVGTELLIRWLDVIYRDSDNKHGRLENPLSSDEEATKNKPQTKSEAWRCGNIISLTLMFQKEVARRIVASPGSKSYGRLSVMAQWLCEVNRAFDIPASAFTPPPKVDSSIITMIPRKKPLVATDKKMLEDVLRAAFGQRRKMLRASLRGLADDTDKLLLLAGIDGKKRAETLSVKEFCNLANLFAEQGQ